MMLSFPKSVPMAVPTFAHVGSSIAHIWMVIYYVFGTFVGDLIPIVIALNYTTAYERITEELIDTCSASYKGYIHLLLQSSIQTTIEKKRERDIIITESV